MDPASTSQPSQSVNLIEEEQFKLQGYIEELETVYSDFVSESEQLWAQFKVSTEEACQGRVAELHRDLAALQDCRVQTCAVEEQFESVYQQVAGMSQQFHSNRAV